MANSGSGSNWRLSSEHVGGAECSFVCHVPGPRGVAPGYFCPSRATSQCFSQASGASRSQHRLSSFLLTKYGSRGCNAVGCANTSDHRPPTNTRSCFSAPEAALNEVEQRFECVYAQTHIYPSCVGGFTLILNRVPLLQAQSHTHFTDAFTHRGATSPGPLG